MKPLLNAIVLGMMMAVTCGGMQIFVTDHAGGGTITLDVEPTDSIENIKSKIQDKRDYLPALQLLYFSGTFLESNRTLGDYDIKKEDLLDLYLVQVLPASGPLTGGNVVVITNMVPSIGDGSDITGVVVGVHTNVPTGQGTNWVAFVAPAGNVTGAVDVLIQSDSAGERRLPQSYTYNPAGVIGGSTMVMRWSAVAQALVPGQASAKGAQNNIYGLDFHNNTLYAGGSFTNIGGSNCYRVAQYDGTNWTSMGEGVVRIANVNTIRGTDHGVYAGGYFTNIGGVNMLGVGRWDGTNWNPVGRVPVVGTAPENRRGLGFSPSVNGYLNWIEPYKDNQVVAGGYFTNTDFQVTGVNYLAVYDGAGWTNMQAGFRNVITTAAYDRERDYLYVGGSFTNHHPTNTSVHLNFIARWNGTHWTNLAQGLGSRAICMAVHPTSGELYIGGWFTNYTDNAGNKYPANNVAKWDPVSQSFTNVGAGFNNWVYSLKFAPDGTLYAGGMFTNTYISTEPDKTAPPLATSRIAMWNGTHWTNMGRGLNDTVNILTVNTNNGDLYAGGFFKIAYNDDDTSTNTWYVAKYGQEVEASSGVEPSSGSVIGGVEVVITGSNLGNGSDITNVTICGVSVASIVSQSDTQVVVIAGSGNPGQGDVRVFSTSYGESVAGDAFTYTGPAFALLGTNSVAVVSGEAADAGAGTHFGALLSGGTATNVFAITNAGNASLNLSWTTNGSTAFSVVSGPSTVAAGEAADFVVAYHSAGLAATAAVQIVHDAAFSPFVFNLASDSAIQPQTITFPPIGDQITTNVVGLAATASSGLPVSFAVVSGPADLTDSTNLSFNASGDVVIRAWQAGDATYEAAMDVTNTFTVTKATASVYLDSLSQTYDGSAKSVIATTDPGGLTVSVTYDGNPWAPTNAGFYAVTGTVNDALWQGSAAGTLEVGKAGQTLSFPAIADQVITNRVGLSATSSSGLAPAFNVSSGPASISGGTNLTFTGAGMVSVVASQAGDADWNPAPSITNTFNVTKAMADVFLSGLRHRYDGAAHSVTVTTDPAGLTVSVTYDGLSWAPTNAGTYAVTALVADVNYQGSAVGSLLIKPAITQVLFAANIDLNRIETYDAATGAQINDALVTNVTSMWGITVASNRLFVSSLNGADNVRAYDAWTGAYLFDLPGSRMGIDVAVVGGTVYVSVYNQGVRSYDVATGAAINTNLVKSSYGAGQGFAVSTARIYTAMNGAAVVRRWDAGSGDLIDESFANTLSFPTDVELDGDMMFVAAGGATLGRKVGLYDVITGVVINDAFVSQDGMRYLAAAEGALYVSSAAASVGVGAYEADSGVPLAGFTMITGNFNGVCSAVLTPKSEQAITFPAIANQATTSTVELVATASSGLPVSFAVGNGPAIITGGTNLTFIGAGDVSIIASQSGDVNYAAAPDVTNTFTVLGLYTVTIVSAHGATDPTVGDQVYLQGSVITNTVTTPDTRGTTQYVAAGWVLAGHEPAIGGDTQVIITVTNDATLTWQWTTNYWLDTEAGPNGAVDVADGWQAAGATVPIEAIPNVYFAFAAWSGDASGSENPLGLLMAGPRSVTASFVALWTTNQPTPHWWLGEYGFTNNVENVVEDDTDGDGYTNADEFIMDTDPTNPASHLAVMELGPAYSSECLELIWTNDAPPYEAVTSVICDVTGIILGWPVSTNRRYDIQSSAAVWPADWQALPGMTGVVPASGWLTITNDLDGEQRVLRLRVGLPE